MASSILHKLHEVKIIMFIAEEKLSILHYEIAILIHEVGHYIGKGHRKREFIDRIFTIR